MNGAYQDQKIARVYTDFLDSFNGQIQRQILGQAISGALPEGDLTLLDAACGTGWLAAELKPRFPKTYACDSSSQLIALGRQRYPAVEFSHCDIQISLPYPDGFFDAIILNMAGPDLSDLDAALKNLAAKTKNGGRLILTLPNPYYTYPAAVWKRSPLDFLLRRKPKLLINKNYFGPEQIIREFGGQTIPSHFYSLSAYFMAAKRANLNFNRLAELKSQTDSSRFDLNYQMFRYPLILLLEFYK
ncbi:MAG: class I SAM-dependent methyltransferase [Patescibacteria group bacterium]|nr:class I SAM-dependent methyltransferase [Patescibacteria group bacterium]